jgi:hypothetical protein
MEIHICTPAERDALKQTAQAPVLEWLRREADDKWVDGMLAAAEEAK